MENVEYEISRIKDKPNFINKDTINMLTVMGSHAYGTAVPDSDWDFYGFTVPPIAYVFPHTTGVIGGFGKNNFKFDQYQGQHLKSRTGESFDITIYNIIRYFSLCMDGNPNMIDSLFTSQESLVFVDNVGQMVRKNKYLFLSQVCYHRFRGMAYSHMSRLQGRVREGKRKDIVDKHGYDTKDASHIVRLLIELEDILFTGELVLGRWSNIITDIKNGNWRKEEIIEFFEKKMSSIENKVKSGKCVVPHSPNEIAIKRLLVNCLEESYGSLQEIGFPHMF